MLKKGCRIYIKNFDSYYSSPTLLYAYSLTVVFLEYTCQVTRLLRSAQNSLRLARQSCKGASTTNLMGDTNLITPLFCVTTSAAPTVAQYFSNGQSSIKIGIMKNYHCFFLKIWFKFPVLILYKQGLITYLNFTSRFLFHILS